MKTGESSDNDFVSDTNEDRSTFVSNRPDSSRFPVLESTPEVQVPLPILDSPECDSDLPGLNTHAQEVIFRCLWQPLLNNQDLKVFHGFLAACIARIPTKEIACLRNLEKILLFDTCVSIFFLNFM